MWPAKEDDPFSSPSLISVKLVGNGGDGGEDDGCEKGGGLLVTATATTTATSLEAGAGGEDRAAVSGGGGGGGRDPAQAGGRGREGRGQAAAPSLLLSLSLSGCTFRNNTARLGGGIAIGPAKSSPVFLETAETVEEPPTTVVALDGVPAARSYEGEETPDPGGAAAAGGGGGSGSGGRASIAAGSRVVLGGKPGGPAGEHSSEGGGVVLSVVLDGATVVSENRATSGGGVWAKGAAVSAVGGKVVVRGNVAGVLEESCGEEVGKIYLKYLMSRMRNVPAASSA